MPRKTYNFDSSAEGWQIYDDDSGQLRGGARFNSHFQAAQSVDNEHGYAPYLATPADFAGDNSSLIGGTINFTYRNADAHVDLNPNAPQYFNPTPLELVLVGNDGTVITKTFPISSTGEQFEQSFNTTLTATDFGVSDDVFYRVMSDLKLIAVDGDLRAGAENTVLRSFSIDAPPDGVVDGEDSGEVMNSGYDDAGGATDGGGDVIGAGNDFVRGNGGNDTINASSGNDTIDGGDDNDSLDGSVGHDKIYGGDGDDTLIGGTGNDTLSGDDALSNELLVNGDFSRTSGWAVNNPTGGAAPSFANAELTFNNGDEAQYGDSVQQTFRSHSGETHQVKLDLRENGGGVGDHTVKIDIIDVSTGAVIKTSTHLVQNGSHATVNFDFTAVGSSSIIRITNTNSTSSVGSDVKVDNVSVRALIDGTGNDSLSGGDGEDLLEGGGGNDTLVGGAEEDTLLGGDGDDLLFPGYGWGESIDGGAGIDHINFSNQNFSVYVSLATETYTGNVNTGRVYNVENVTGSQGADTINGDAGANMLSGQFGMDSISGGAGNDTIYGGASVDTLLGGDDDDLIDGGYSTDSMDGGAGNDTVSFEGAFGSASEFVNVDLQAETAQLNGGSQVEAVRNFENAIGSAGNDTVLGTSDANRLEGGDGNDSVDGRAGNDTLYGGDGKDTLVGGDGRDILYGGDGDDVIDTFKGSTSGFEAGAEGAGNADHAYGGAGNDLIYGGFGFLEVYDGGADNDTLSFQGLGVASKVNINLANMVYGLGTGGVGAVTNIENVVGTWGDDTIIGNGQDNYLSGGYTGAGNDTISGGAGHDTVDGGIGNDSLSGDDGNDSVVGGEGADTLSGGIGDDTLIGGDGKDSLISGTGDDRMTGGDGDDRFVITPGGGDVTITDFNTGNSGSIRDGDQTNNDFIDLSGFYDHRTELVADLRDDGILNQSNATDTAGRAVDYSDNSQFGAGGLTLSGVAARDLNYDNTNVLCFAEGTLIQTPYGEVPVQDLRPGDLVQTMDNGLKPILFIASRKVGPKALARHPNMRPVLIPQGVMGARQDLLVSQQHAVLTGIGTIARAKHLAEVPKNRIRVAHGKRHVHYYHIMCEAHQILFANGVATESFLPGPQALETLSASSRVRLLGEFPELFMEGAQPRTAMSPVRPFETQRSITETAAALTWG
jgi:Ca2+-binding RTX toxin-like protein